MDITNGESIAEAAVLKEIANDLLNVVEAAPEPEESDDLRFRRWQSQRPDVSHLPPGLCMVEGTLFPVFDVGDRIVVERMTTLLPGMPWLDTIVGKVRSIDDDTGLVTLWDEDCDQRNPAVRYVSFSPAHRDHHVFKLAPAKGNPFDAPKVARAANLEARVKVDGKRGRGRPKGSKNRPKEEIKAEKAARREARGR